MANRITVETTVQAPLENVWRHWNEPNLVQEWNAASDDWYCPSAKNDLRVGGEFHYQMSARDKSFEFDFWGTYKEIEPHKRIVSTMGDGRFLEVIFTETPEGVHVVETFEAEGEHSEDMQRSGWQAILNRFKTQVEKV